MDIEEALRWVDRNCTDAATLDRLRSRRVAATLAEEIERLRQVARNIYEVWAGSEGIPMPETAAEAYLLRLVEQMRDEAKNGLRNVQIEARAAVCPSLSNAGLGFEKGEK